MLIFFGRDKEDNMTSPSKMKYPVSCSKCGIEMMVRGDYLKRHSGVCMSCQKTGNSHALKHGDYKERLYKIWQGMFHRRYRINPDVCIDWHSYEEFRGWSLRNGYSEDLTIDRIDNKKGYSPDNCEWITLKENSGKDKKLLTDDEKILVRSKRKLLGLTQEQYAKKIGVSRNTIQRAERFERDRNEQ